MAHKSKGHRAAIGSIRVFGTLRPLGAPEYRGENWYSTGAHIPGSAVRFPPPLYCVVFVDVNLPMVVIGWEQIFSGFKHVTERNVLRRY